MNIIGLLENKQSGIFEALRDEGAPSHRAGLLAAYVGGAREKAPASLPGSSDSVFISEAAMLLASGLLTQDDPLVDADESGALHKDGQDSVSLYSQAGIKASVRARIAALWGRTEASTANAALLAPLPPGGDDPEGHNKALHGNNPDSSSEAAFAVARLQNRLRELQRELSTLEGVNAPEEARASRMYSLTSRINQTTQDINGLLHRNRS